MAMHRRKLKPTHMRTIFGDGSGAALDNVVPIDFGRDLGKIKIGALACWEHTQPLLKYHTYSQRKVIHISMWPPIDPQEGAESPALFSMSAEECFNLSQTYATEGGSYVLHSTAVWKESGIETMRIAGGCFLGPQAADTAL